MFPPRFRTARLAALACLACWVAASTARGQLTRADIQKLIDAAKPANADGRGRVEIGQPGGTHRLDGPLWLNNANVDNVFAPGTRLKCNGNFPAFVVGYRAAPMAAPTFDGKARLSLRSSPFDLGPWAGGGNRVRPWEAVGAVRYVVKMTRTDDRWTRSSLIGWPDQRPPFLLMVDADNRLAIRACRGGDPSACTARFAVPADSADLSLDITIDCDAGRPTILVNGQPVVASVQGPWAAGMRLVPPTNNSFAVPPNSEIAPPGRFTLNQLEVWADGVKACELDPAPKGDGTWRWQQKSTGTSGLGFCVPVPWSSWGMPGGIAVHNAETEMPGNPYGSALAIGTTTQFKAVNCTFLKGARAVDQEPIDSTYVNEFVDCQFKYQSDASLVLDYGIYKLVRSKINGTTRNQFVRLNRTSLAVEGGMWNTETLQSALKSTDSGSIDVKGLLINFEVAPFPPYLLDVERGQNNGGFTDVSIADTEGTNVAPGGAFLILRDPYAGQVRLPNRGPAVVRADRKFRKFLRPDTNLVTFDPPSANAWVADIEPITPTGVMPMPIAPAPVTPPTPPTIPPGPAPLPGDAPTPPGPATGPAAPMPPVPGTPSVGRSPAARPAAPGKRLPRRRAA